METPPPWHATIYWFVNLFYAGFKDSLKPAYFGFKDEEGR